MSFSVQLSTSNADETKLFFLLGDTPTTFNEDDDRYQAFFQNRYISLAVYLRKKLPHVSAETMKFLNDGVFLQEDEEERAEVDEKQAAYEQDLVKEIEEASHLFQRRRKEVLADLWNEEPQVEQDQDA